MAQLIIGKRGLAMSRLLDELFHIQADGKGFEQLDNVMARECELQLQQFRRQLQPQDYEQVRDVVFSIAYLAKESAFKIGFKTAVKLLLECRHDK